MRAHENRPYHSCKGQFSDQKVRGALVFPNLTKSLCAGPKPPLLSWGFWSLCTANIYEKKKGQRKTKTKEKKDWEKGVGEWGERREKKEGLKDKGRTGGAVGHYTRRNM